jgi:molybdopterin-containing oxidoreductase family iron-sulfur binding subunit
MIKEIPEKNLDNGKRYWKSLDDLAGTPGFKSWVEREFPEGASMLEGVQRRGFVKLMAASFGLAGLGMTGCRRPEHTILPYGKSPEELIPGVPNFYATSMPTAQGNIPLIVESHNGRPTKVEGNPSYIPFGGSTNIYAQATILDIYDPDRTRNPVEIDSKDNTSFKTVTTSQVLDHASKWIQGGKVAILADKSFSLARQQLKEQLKSKGVLWCEHEAIDLTKPEIGLGKVFGINKGLRLIPNLRKASRILSLDSDFLGNREPNSLANTRALMKGRKVLSANDAKKMNRLYSVEADLTITGGVADHRLRLDSSQFTAFANLLAAEILTLLKKGDIELINHLNQRGASLKRHKKWIIECAKDLCKKPKGSVILPGSHLPSEVHALSLMLNQELGAIGNTVDYHHTNNPESTISDLFKSVNDSSIDTVIFLGGNPVLSSNGFDWEDFSSKVSNKLHLGHSFNETSSICNFHLGQSHFLESWDEGMTWDGTAIVPVQPLVAPLFDTISDIELLLSFLGSESSSHDFIMSLQEKRSSKKSYEDFLRLGIEKLNPKTQNADFDLSILNQFKDETTHQPSADNLEVLLVPDFHAWDGRFANNGWMQECPDPISKLTWDNALLISPVLAKQLEAKYPDLGLLPKPTMLNKNGQIAPDNAVFDHGKQKAPIVKLSVSENQFIEGPLYVQPGLADYTIIASLGLGRESVGNVGKGTGYNSYPLLDNDSNRIIPKVSLKPTGEFKILANVQEHWSMEGRAIVREGNAEEYISDEGFASHMGAESHSPKIWGQDQEADLAFKAKTTPRGNSSYEHPDHNYEKSETPGLHQWGMAIDLNQCTGCSACVVACQSENNIPIVGKDQVLRGREMHWIRLDRYFSSTERDGGELPSDVQVSFQGVACMHCETAPCETVCPVNATVHDEEGLNAMAYNRCVGTRYCANNCPYKVRRFNFFDWNKRNTEELYKGPLGEENDSLPDMGKNPDVTVRMRGVMEKCTYCVQRIQEAKIQVKVKAQRNALLQSGKDGADIELNESEIKVPDGSIKTACQQVCPSDSITFGDISDPESEVSKLKNNSRDYSVLGYLNTRPRTTFLAKVRNPNPQMPDFETSPHSSREYHDKAHPAHHNDGDHKIDQEENH